MYPPMCSHWHHVVSPKTVLLHAFIAPSIAHARHIEESCDGNVK